MPVPTSERRADPRLAGPFGAFVRVTESTGRRQTEAAIVEDVSRRALRVRVRDHRVPASGRLFLLVHLTAVDPDRGPRVAVVGYVRRIDPRPNGAVAVMVEISRHRWLFARIGSRGHAVDFESFSS